MDAPSPSCSAGNSPMSASTSPCPSSLLRLPLNKLRPLLKLDPDVQLTSSDAVFLLARATELFIETLAQESAEAMTSRKVKTVGVQDVEEAVERGAEEGLLFLQGGVLDMDYKDVLKGTTHLMEDQPSDKK